MATPPQPPTREQHIVAQSKLMLPCPFCGGNSQKRRDPVGLREELGSENVEPFCACGCEGPWFSSAEAAVAWWNKRAAGLSPLQELGAAIREEMDRDHPAKAAT